MEASTELEIKVISATHLWAFNFFQKLSVYATASLTGDHLPSDAAQPQRTPSDPDGDGHPDWKSHPMTFRLPPSPPNNLFLRFELRHHAGLPFPDRTIGVVNVPLSDLLPSDAFRFVDYQVRSSDGKSSNGDFRFAYRLNRVGSHAPTVSISGYPQIDDSAESLWDPIPAQETPPPANHLTSDPQPPANHLTHYPMWPPPPPPPPYWAPPGFPHPPPPYPPPGHFHWPRSYPPPTESQRNNGR